MQGVLRKIKANNKFGYQDIIDRYFDQWENRYDDLLSSDPCSFPGFRLSIESALNNDLPPCGVVTGIGTLKETNEGAIANPRVGVVISNVQFQAGAFDMASAEKVLSFIGRVCRTELASGLLHILWRYANQRRGGRAIFNGCGKRSNYTICQRS